MQDAPSFKQFKKLIEDYIRGQFTLIEAYALNRFGVDGHIQCEVSFANSRKTSKGGIKKNGQMYVSILGNKWLRYAYNDWKVDIVSDNHHYNEYAGFRTSEKIGEFNGYWTIGIVAILCHEIAHAIQFNRTHGSGASIDSGYESARIYATDNKIHAKHGLDWQYIYQILRDEFVNPYIGDTTKYIPPKIESVM